MSASRTAEALPGLWQNQALVFATEAGSRVHCDNTNSHSFKSLLDKAGLPHSIHFHDLRHTWAILLCSKNVDPKLVQDMLGHANIPQTLDVYSHVLPTCKTKPQPP
jgi:site-specific recombinase XerD